MTTAEVARLLDVSPATVRRWVREGELKPAKPKSPHLHRAKSLTFRREDVEALRPK